MTEHRKNYYEELIDKMMIDEVLNEEVRDLLQNNLNVKKKRIAILSALEDNNKQKTFLFNKIKSLINNNDVTATQHIQEVVTMLRDYVAYGDVEKKKFGEVMTPTSLVEEMLDTLPIEVWTNPDLKWLDPANGVGVFPAIVVQRLMEGLKDFEPCEEKRYAHIMENMIYVCELQPKNMFLYLCGFDPEDKYELNIYSGSFLDDEFDEHMSEVYGVEKFDIIVGNPPYNPHVQNNGTRKGSGLKIWHKFIEKGLQLLKENSYFTFITPAHWRLGNFSNSIISKVQRQMWKYNILKIGAANNYFKNNIANHMKLDYWLIQLSPPNNKMTKHTALLKHNYYPIVSNLDELNNFFLAIENEECFNIDIKGNRSYDYNCQRKVTSSNTPFLFKHFNTFSQYKKNEYDWYDVKTEGFDNKKVIITNSVNLNVKENRLAVYDNGYTGCGHNSCAYSVESESDGLLLQYYLNNSTLIRNIIAEFIGPAGYAVPVNVFKRIPKRYVMEFVSLNNYKYEN